MSSFPILQIRADKLEAQGSFAKAQSEFLYPDSETIKELDAYLIEHSIGVVAHFYMDAELQGVLSACTYEHIYVADSLLMADHAVRMAEKGVKSIIVLGVDFMSENVRAVLDSAGFSNIPVYRVAEQEIGCSLAEAAESNTYLAWLQKASQTPNSLHVVYINTSLETKAVAHNIIPTVTCTSSNVVQTILQAFAEIPDLTVWYGPDTYMGANLAEMFRMFSEMSDEEIGRIHPKHNRATIEKLRSRFHYFLQGNCIVHHMFGAKVVEQVRKDYADAYHSAHLEVPGEMFALAMEAQQNGRGVIGSTSNILNFILEKVDQAVEGKAGETIPVVLGTEAGMVTAIVRKVQEKLQDSGRDDIGVDIIFPVASEAVAQDDELGIIPGVQGGEGCSTAGGCATCPFMKMNSLDALFTICEEIGKGDVDLQSFEPEKYSRLIEGQTVAKLGGEPILFMRHFQKFAVHAPNLVKQVQEA